MIYICVIPIAKVKSVRQAVDHQAGVFKEIKNRGRDGITIAAIIADELPDDVHVLAAIPYPRFCPECFHEGNYKPLPRHNKYGYCREHRELSPERLSRRRKTGIDR